MIPHSPSGWNTWDFRGFNRLVYLDQGRIAVIVQYGIWDESFRPTDEIKNRGGVRRAFRWTDVTRLGPHAPLGLPAVLDFRAGEADFRGETLDHDGTLELAITPLTPTRQRVVFLLLAPDGESPAVTSPTSAIFANFELALSGATWPYDYFLNIAEPYALGAPGEPATLHVTPPAALLRRLRTARRRQALPTRVAPHADDRADPARAQLIAAHVAGTLHGTGALADAPEAMLRAVTWNTLFDTHRKLVCTPVSRDWANDWKGCAVWGWDTFLIGALVSTASPELARLNFESVTAGIADVGMVANYYLAHGAVSRDRSMPCIGAYLIWKTQRLRPDRKWLRTIYPLLRRWHDYWPQHRTGNDCLLAWGSDAEPHFEFPQLLQDNPQIQHSAKCAMYESGLDNSPMFDDVAFNPRTHTLELSDVALNSYYAMDCEALAEIAATVGEPDQATAYRGEYERVCERINVHLWDDTHGIYANRHWDGRFSRRWSPTSFFPLIAGVATPQQAERLVREHLLNEAQFWGRFVLPSIARNDPAYPDNDYWRGRIWGPFNLLVAEGLRRYRFDRAAADLARLSTELFLDNWRRDGGVYENYNAETGAGGDVWNAARLYHWGGLLAYLGIQELIDVETTGWLRLGSLYFPDAGLKNVHAGGHTFDVSLDRGVHVQRDGRPYLECSTRALVRLPVGVGWASRPPFPTNPPCIELYVRNSGELTLFDPAARFRRARLIRELPGAPPPDRAAAPVLSATRRPDGWHWTWT